MYKVQFAKLQLLAFTAHDIFVRQKTQFEAKTHFSKLTSSAAAVIGEE